MGRICREGEEKEDQGKKPRAADAEGKAEDWHFAAIVRRKWVCPGWRLMLWRAKLRATFKSMSLGIQKSERCKPQAHLLVPSGLGGPMPWLHFLV